LCEHCHPKGFVATHTFAECRKHAQSLKRDSSTRLSLDRTRPPSQTSSIHQMSSSD
jgi:hypothetical protein